ncbi:hypothetical protein D3C86_1726350 [compost metagenome]
MPGAHFPGALGEGQDQLQVHRAEGLLGAGLADGGAEAAEGGIDPAVQLRQQLGQWPDGIPQVRMLGQGTAGRGLNLRHGGFVEQAVEQVLAGESSGAG